MLNAVHYIPLVTTVLSAWFGTHLFIRWRERPERAHHGWWAFGVWIYGLGTLAESITTLYGWSPGVSRLWYVTGALLGGAPLAQGSVYFHFKRSTAHAMSAVLVPYLLVATALVVVSPIDLSLVTPHGLSGKVLAWKWVRMLSPVVNLYAVIFLIGGAVRSAIQHWNRPATRTIAHGNAMIALGAILPGIGGSFSRAGHTEVLYVLECIGLLCIWNGFHRCTAMERARVVIEVPAQHAAA
ncbi:MAG: hypothetical protein ABL977_02930 [Candidatus Eisenbacteria bacterium]